MKVMNEIVRRYDESAVADLLDSLSWFCQVRYTLRSW